MAHTLSCGDPMSEATKDIQDSNDLDARVAALKGDTGEPAQAAPPPADGVDFEALAAEAVNQIVSESPSQPAAESPTLTVDEALAHFEAQGLFGERPAVRV